ncbi:MULTISPECIES: glycosyltransferase [Paraburkholderia]|uniref:glycosyltransferase n=1 Tax=Paraburkholderia TaxID=1822464 RepID=UPI00047733B8|nr:MULTISPECIES: glycosyltransferase [Paraburkholderia]MDH6148880.1 glycosyltransferase involved in cell wall biosynthesis [Paraburkholderia sp. WSM4179]
MFKVDIAPLAYSDPWILPLSERMRMLTRGKRRVAYFYEEPNNSTFRYRAYNMVQVLNQDERGGVSASFFFLQDWARIDEIADLADVLVICRSRYCHRINQLVMKFRLRGKRILFDIDDFVFDSSFAHLIMNTLDEDVGDPGRWDYWFSYIGRLGAALKMCDGAITTNAFLAGKITAFSGLPVSVVPNFMNKEQLDFSDALFRHKQVKGFARDDKIHLGYFSGSPSHKLDYAIIVPAIEALLAKDPRIELMVVGYIEAGPALSKFGDRVKRQPFQDYVNLQRLISTVEFNLMPLQSNDFTNCKSELKYFEAAVVGAISVASPSYTYVNSIRNDENGYLAQAHEWFSVIERAIENDSGWSTLIENAREDARSKYAWFNQRETILAALQLD